MFRKVLFFSLIVLGFSSITNADDFHLRLLAPVEVNIPFYTSRVEKYYLGPYYKSTLYGPFYDNNVGEYYKPYYHTPHYHGPYYHHHFHANNFRITIFK